MPFNPATAVRGPRHSVKKGQDPGACAGGSPAAPGQHRHHHADRLAGSGADRADGLFLRAHRSGARHAGGRCLHPAAAALGPVT